jgi:tRNA/rRNA methyltransferase
MKYRVFGQTLHSINLNAISIIAKYLPAFRGFIFLWSMEIHFILVRPSLPENVGAAARAIKTMGFKSLRLVAPCNHLDDRALWLAHGSHDILQAAQVFGKLQSALDDVDLSIGTTARKRAQRQDSFAPQEIIEAIAAKGRLVRSCAIVFGREDTGLLNEELGLCDLTSSIPMARKYPSLNLAQSVMVYAYSLAGLALPGKRPDKAGKDKRQYRSFLRSLSDLCNEVGIAHSSSLHKRILERAAGLSEIDIRLGHTVLGKIKQRFF